MHLVAAAVVVATAVESEGGGDQIVSMVGAAHHQVLNTHPGHRGDLAVVDGYVDGLTRCRPKKGSTQASGWMVHRRSAFASRPLPSFPFARLIFLGWVKYLHNQTAFRRAS